MELRLKPNKLSNQQTIKLTNYKTNKPTNLMDQQPKIYNPASGRYVLKSGLIGKNLLKTYTEEKLIEMSKTAATTAATTTVSKKPSKPTNTNSNKNVWMMEEESVESQEYVETLVPYFFQVCPFKTHTYKNNEPDTFNMHLIYQQMNSLADEYTLINWGSGIFVATDETRPYLFKFMIIGPPSTPYENGCFIFDMFLNDFPNKPPKVTFLTTDGGRVRFNPNLYNCGKVCLSLLGTWSGPAWMPDKSTILQIVVSIQSLILNEEPYCNEPSFEKSAGTHQSNAYNTNIRKQTHRVAIIDTLKNIGNDQYQPFSEIIKAHFRIKKNQIIKTLISWEIETDSFIACIDA